MSLALIVILGILWMWFLFLDNEQNYFPINLGTFNNNYFLPKLLESYGSLLQYVQKPSVLRESWPFKGDVVACIGHPRSKEKN